jgi:hypothetical protein
MHVLVDFTVFSTNGRKTPVGNGYRPPWRLVDELGDAVGDYHDAAIWLPSGRDTVDLGDTVPALLQPLCPELWDFAVPGTILYAYEGKHRTAMVVIRRVFQTVRTGVSQVGSK